MTIGSPIVLAVSGSTHPGSSTSAVLNELAVRLTERGAKVDLLNLACSPLRLFHPETARETSEYRTIQPTLAGSDVLILGTPDYHGCMSGALKNFLDHFWAEYAGKLLVPVVASYDKGLTVMDQIRTVARQCYAWALPYGIAYHEKQDLTADKVPNDILIDRLSMAARDIVVYGRLLAAQRSADLAGREPGFMARYRSPS